MDIHNLMIDTGDDVFYSEGFHTCLESHLTYLRNLSTSTVYPLEPFLTYKYEGDLFGLLDIMQIPKKYHWVIMKLNNYRSTGDLLHGTYSLVLPDFNEVDVIKSIYQTKVSNI